LSFLQDLKSSFTRTCGGKEENESESKILSFRKKFIGFAPSIAAGLVLVFVAASLIITRGLFGNVPSTNTGGSMGIEYSGMMESDQKIIKMVSTTD